jgi:hypothetical protein
MIKPTRHVGFSLKKTPTNTLSKKESEGNLAKANQRHSIFGLLKGGRRANAKEETEKQPEPTSEQDKDTSEGETPSRWKRLCC